jgi:hypothetical protein
MLTFRRLAPVFVGALLIACDDDSTGPGAVDLRLVASSFENLGLSRSRGGDPDGAAASQAASLALRTGTRPARVRIAVDGVTEEYWALEIEHVLAGGDDMLSTLPGPLLTRTMVAWRGAPAERVIAITIASDTGTFSLMRYQTLQTLPYDRIFFEPAFGVMFERAGPVHLAVDGGARSTRESIGGECPLPRRRSILQLLSPVYIPPTQCHAARFMTRFNMHVQEAPIGDATALRTRVVEMQGQDVPGVQLRSEWIYRSCPVC